MAEFRIATYNVNSVRSRLHIVIPWLESHKPAVLCMQETKTADPHFPAGDFEGAGYHVLFRGASKGSGVAIASTEIPSDVVYGLEDGGPVDADRLISARFSGVTVVNAYVPQGFKMQNPQFAYKLEWLKRLGDYLHAVFPRGSS